LPSPAFIGDDGRIELSYSINFFVGDQPIMQREMEGSDEGEVNLKELKDTVLLLAKQMVLFLRVGVIHDLLPLYRLLDTRCSSLLDTRCSSWRIL